MTFCFNWGKMDETAADAICLLINKKIQSALDAKFGSQGDNSNRNNGTSGAKPPDGHHHHHHHSNTIYVNDVIARPDTAAGSASLSLSTSTTLNNTPAPQHVSVTSQATTGHNINNNNNNVSSASNHNHASTSRRLPPVEHLSVSSIEWGTTPPFIELVSFENALAVVPGGGPTKTPSSTLTSRFCDSFSSSTGMAASPSGLGVAGANHLDSPIASSIAEPSNTTSTSNNVYVDTLMAEVYGSGGGGAAAAATSQFSTNPPPPVATPNASLATSVPMGGAAAAAAAATTGATTPTGAVVDTLAPFIGPGGLFVRFHVTYGGSMRFSMEAVVQHSITFGPISLPVRMPIALHVSEMDLDCYVCINLRDNACQLWLEPGKLSASPINRMNMTCVFGEKAADSCEVNSTGFVSSQYAGSEDDDNGTVLIDEREIAQFALFELKAVLREKLTAPHYVSIPIFC